MPTATPDVRSSPTVLIRPAVALDSGPFCFLTRWPMARKDLNRDSQPAPSSGRHDRRRVASPVAVHSPRGRKLSRFRPRALVAPTTLSFRSAAPPFLLKSSNRVTARGPSPVSPSLPWSQPISHIVHIEAKVRDPVAISSACSRLSLPEPVPGEHQLFTSRISGLAIQLPRWQYPIVCQIETGEIKYDNYEGRWGEPAQLDRFLQGYAVEVTKLEARRQGYSITEQALDDGSIRLTVQVGGHTSQ